MASAGSKLPMVEPGKNATLDFGIRWDTGILSGEVKSEATVKTSSYG